MWPGTRISVVASMFMLTVVALMLTGYGLF
jgi:hypothetical protein